MGVYGHFWDEWELEVLGERAFLLDAKGFGIT